LATSSTPTAFRFSTSSLRVSACVMTVRLGDPGWGEGNAFEVLQRLPRRMVKS